MNSLHSRMSGLLAAGCVGLMLFCSSAFAQFVSREQIVEALTTQPASLNFTDRLGLTRSLTLKVANVAASVQPKATIDLHEVFFEFNSAAVTDEAKPRVSVLREAGRRLSLATRWPNVRRDGPGAYVIEITCTAKAGDALNRRATNLPGRGGAHL